MNENAASTFSSFINCNWLYSLNVYFLGRRNKTEDGLVWNETKTPRIIYFDVPTYRFATVFYNILNKKIINRIVANEVIVIPKPWIEKNSTVWLLKKKHEVFSWHLTLPLFKSLFVFVKFCHFLTATDDEL